MNKKTISVIVAVIGIVLVVLAGLYLSNANVRKVRNAEKKVVDDVTVYNESINITVDGKLSNKYSLVNKKKLDEKQEFTTTDYVDQGIEANKIPNGTYYIALGEDYLTATDSKAFEDIEFYTITRDNKNQQVIIKNDPITGALTLTKEDSELPEDTYDIMIDPGHGGNDPGSIGIDGVTKESELTLKISKILKKSLEAEGYKVGITREDDVNPGNNPEGLDNYGKGSRIGQVYEANAKMNISMHYNTGQNSGYEVYTSVSTSSDLANLFEKNIQESLYPSTKVDYCNNGDCKTPLTYDSNLDSDLGIDYLFAIREVAGRNLETFSEDNKYISNSAVGAEGILVESGYIDNIEDLQNLSSEETMQAECKEITKAINEYLQ